MIRKNWLEKAEITPDKVHPRASSFANWVYFASHGNHKKRTLDEKYNEKKLMNLGRYDHNHVELFMQLKWSNENLSINERNKSDWSILFIDDGSSSQIFRASRLLVKDQPLRCRPDAILFNKKENKYLIIEHKTTRTPPQKIPQNAWPNVQAQLWCYSWIDDFEDADEVIMVGKLWILDSFRKLRQIHHSHASWKKSDQDHHNECLSWFKRYGGKFVCD